MQQLTLDAIDPLADAVAWKRQNAVAYAQIVEWARQDIAAGYRPAIDLYANLLRRPHFARKLGLIWSDESYAVNNNLRSSLARLVEREHADVRFEIRRASCDSPGAINATPHTPQGPPSPVGATPSEAFGSPRPEASPEGIA